MMLPSVCLDSGIHVASGEISLPKMSRSLKRRRRMQTFAACNAVRAESKNPISDRDREHKLNEIMTMVRELHGWMIPASQNMAYLPAYLPAFSADGAPDYGACNGFTFNANAESFVAAGDAFLSPDEVHV